MNGAYVKLYCKKLKIKPDGTAPIYFAIRLGKEKLLYTGKSIDPKYFNNNGGGEITNKKLYSMLNIYLENEKNKINAIILDLQYKKEVLTFEKIIAKYQNKTNQESFLTFAFSELEKEKTTLAFKTYEDYFVSLKSLKDYRPEVSFEDLTYKFLKEFEIWLKIEKKRNQTSRASNFTAIRKYLNLAIKYELTTNYPFKQFKFSPGTKERDYLLEKELKALQKLYDSNKLIEKLQNTLANFLFTCYTGIAGDDMKNKYRFNISEDTITFDRGKTNKPSKVPLSNLAKRMLPEIQERKLKMKINEVTKDLEEIMLIAKINKKFTYHAGRHTFAIISLMKGISLSVISKVLGHTSTKTTEIYAKVVDELLNQEMKKWDDPEPVKRAVKKKPAKRQAKETKKAE